MNTQVNTEIDESKRKEIAQALSRVLADTYTLYLKTHNFHWNVTGPQFNSLHTLFETQYTELAAAVDEIAERIRALDVRAPGSYREFAELGSIEEAEGTEKASDMVKKLSDDQGKVVASAKSALEIAADANDDVSADLMTQRMAIHEKTGWMLRAMLEG